MTREEHADRIWPGWVACDCGCYCGEVEGRGRYWRECPKCKGWGRFWKHKESGVLAVYPGGPFLGREPNVPEYIKRRKK